MLGINKTQKSKKTPGEKKSTEVLEEAQPQNHQPPQKTENDTGDPPTE